MDWFLYDNGPRHERVNEIFKKVNENHNHVNIQTTINSITLPQPSIKYYGKYFVNILYISSFAVFFCKGKPFVSVCFF